MLASELIEEIRALGSITPDTADTDILKAADAEIRTRLLPWVRGLNEEFLVRSIDLTAVNGRVALPPRASGASVRLVQVVLSSGLLGPPLPRLDPAFDPGASSGGLPYGFYIDGGGLVLLPVSSSATVRVRYFARPGKLALESDAALCKVITSVTPGPVITTIVAGGFALTKIDIVAGGPAHQHKAIYADLAGGVTLQTAQLLEPLTASSETGYGDFVTAPDRSPVVALPEELGSVLALRTAARLLAGNGYLGEARAHYDMADKAQSEAEPLLRPRSDGNPKRLTGGVLGRLGQGTPGPWGRW